MDERDYEVGYGKPPVSTRFQKGHKGHKRVNPRKPISLSARLSGILAEVLTVTENGKSQRMTKEEVFVRQLVNRALAGDRHASALLIKFLIERHQGPDPDGTRATDEFLFAELMRMFKHDDGGSGDDQT